MFNEGSSKLVNKKTGKIRPPKPVRSDYASIITAEHGFKGIIKEPTGFLVGEKNKPELVQVTPLTEPEEICCDCGKSIPLSKLGSHPVICR